MCSSSERPDLAVAALGAACQPLPPRQCHVTPVHKAAVPTHFLQITLPPSKTIHRRRNKTLEGKKPAPEEPTKRLRHSAEKE